MVRDVLLVLLPTVIVASDAVCIDVVPNGERRLQMTWRTIIASTEPLEQTGVVVMPPTQTEGEGYTSHVVTQVVAKLTLAKLCVDCKNIRFYRPNARCNVSRHQLMT